MEFNNTLIHADCFDILPLIPDHSVHLILTDMPYNKTCLDWDKLIINLELLWKEYQRILTPNGIVCLFGTEPFTSRIVSSNLKWFQYKWIWKKQKSSNFMQAKTRPLNNYEEICIFYNSKLDTHIYNPIQTERELVGKNRILSAIQNNEKPRVRTDSSVVSLLFSSNRKKQLITNVKTLNPNLKYPELIINNIPAIVSTSKERVDHNTQKPIKLYEYFIQTYTNPKMVVLDTFSGSGTNYEACLNLNRIPICIEKEAKFIQITKQRLQKRNVILNPISINNKIKIWQSSNYFQQLHII